MTMIANKTHLGHPTKRRKTSSSSPDWSGFHTDLWESILNRLSIADLLRVRAVCHSWCSLAKARISSLESPLFDEPPLMLMLPTDQADQINSRHCLYNPTEKKVYKQLTMNIPQDLGHTGCIGSSHGWLIFFDYQKSIPCMFSPFLEVRLQLPPLFSFTHIEKAILSSDPIHSDNNYWVVVIYGVKSKLAFSKSGDTNWTTLSGANQHYCDIISYHHHLIALAETGSVEIWNFRSCIPVKEMDIIKPSFPNKMVEFENSLGDGLYFTRSYIVESNGDLLLIMRYIGNFVREDGVLVHEADLLDDEQKQYLIRPCITKLFHVYKMDFNSEKWVRLDSLGDDCTLFLGRNQSVSLPSKSFPFCKGNSIYFTDDYWDQMDEQDMYGGHDTGRFDLKDHSIELINEDSDEDDLQKIQLLPIWLVPNPW